MCLQAFANGLGNTVPSSGQIACDMPIKPHCMNDKFLLQLLFLKIFLSIFMEDEAQG